MGGAVSSGTSNSELVDNLCSENYITRPDVERVFRAVDRADYMTFTEDGDRLEAYEDHAWRRESVHISAPCIYTKAMEALKLKERLSFLNIGSGTGYLSTMAGLLLGSAGVSHGIEIHPENVEYASERLVEFKERSQWYDPLTFCEPVFLVGNGLLMSPGHMQYDRVYCGAACPPQHLHLMRSLLKVGGILVFPIDNKLESVRRVAEDEWTSDVILPSVSFACLITPSDEELKQLPAVEFRLEPGSLKQLCRLAVLRHVTRPCYSRISSLPLPIHLKEYVAHYREWGPLPAPLPLHCAQTQQDRPQQLPSPARQSGPMANAVSINGRRVFLCSFNGVVFQIPIDSDDSGDEQRNNDHGGEAAGYSSDHGGEAAGYSSDHGGEAAGYSSGHGGEAVGYSSDHGGEGVGYSSDHGGEGAGYSSDHMEGMDQSENRSPSAEEHSDCLCMHLSKD